MPKDSDDDAPSNATSIAPSNPPGSPPSSAQAMLGQCPSPSPSPSIQNPSSAVVDSTVVAPEDWWKTAPLPEGEEPEKPNNPAVVMAVALRKLHVSVTAVHPTLLEWVAKGVTLQVLTEAVQLVRMRPGKESGPINPNYLATVLASMQNPVPARSTAAIEAKPWWESKAGIEAKGRELDLEPAGPEKEIFAYYRDRVFAKAGHGPWSEKTRTAPTVHEMRKVGDVVAG
ncbi:hypothetical protein ACFQUU_08680 [Herbaspirillum sp. GCM10030257]|uniref:hypothetical protein n=1 Tax=Herbaspirillum sp. GCM10030257 TaxID=3273393 RepID=UPI0036073F75